MNVTQATRADPLRFAMLVCKIMEILFLWKMVTIGCFSFWNLLKKLQALTHLYSIHWGLPNIVLALYYFIYRLMQLQFLNYILLVIKPKSFSLDFVKNKLNLRK